MSINDLYLRDLHAVAAVATLGHFGRAAESLALAQPTLSAQVRKVELALGGALFERSGRRVFITPTGERLLPLIRELLAHAEHLGDEAAARAEAGLPRPIRLGVIPTLAPYLMPHVLLPLSRRGRGLSLLITEQTTARLLELLRQGLLDAAILSLPIRGESLECEALFDEAFQLIAPRGHALATGERLGPSRLCACDMVLLEEGHCLRDQALSVCGKRGGSKPRLVTTSIETLKYLVASGQGYSLLPRLACGLTPELARLVEVRAFDEREPSRRIGLFFRRTSARASDVRRLAAFLRSHPPPGVMFCAAPKPDGTRATRA